MERHRKHDWVGALFFGVLRLFLGNLKGVER